MKNTKVRLAGRTENCSKPKEIHVEFIATRCDGVVVRASASQLVDLGFIPLVESYQKTLKVVSIASLLGARPLWEVV